MATGKKDRCEECVYRGYNMSQNRCDFALLTGRTRKAQPPEKCSYFIPGPRLVSTHVTLPGEEAAYVKATGLRPRTKYDWDAVMCLYRKGMNDGEISRETGIPKRTVHGWRYRNHLPSNAGTGKKKEQ